MLTYKIGWQRFDEELLTGKRPPTKREMLKVLMTIFDPLGLIAHYLSFLKVVLQDVWRSGIDWDEEVKSAEYEEWAKWVEVLPQVEHVKINRCYTIDPSFSNADDVQLHTFADAGKNGMAAVVYLRTVIAGKVNVCIMAAKTKVAPIKLTSIPRLELEAARIGARLSRTITEALG